MNRRRNRTSITRKISLQYNDFRSDNFPRVTIYYRNINYTGTYNSCTKLGRGRSLRFAHLLRHKNDRVLTSIMHAERRFVATPTKQRRNEFRGGREDEDKKKKPTGNLAFVIKTITEHCSLTRFNNNTGVLSRINLTNRRYDASHPFLVDLRPTESYRNLIEKFFYIFTTRF